MTQNRTHTCGELRLADAGKAVKLCGWMENIRVVSAGLDARNQGTIIRE